MSEPGWADVLRFLQSRAGESTVCIFVAALTALLVIGVYRAFWG
jgi:hypothetical protein